jgi:hypothetical protein
MMGVRSFILTLAKILTTHLSYRNVSLHLVRAKRWRLLFNQRQISAIILLNVVDGYPLVTRRFSSDKATAPE